jgi:hypothetical protein
MKNTILYSPSLNTPLIEYVGIGGNDVDPQDPESSLLPKDQSIEGWKEFLDITEAIYPVTAVNYIILNEMPEAYLPEQLLKNFRNNEAEIEEIVHNWFEPDSSHFKFLDLINCDFSNEVKELIELNDQEIKYIFKDGSIIIINEDEIYREQYFVPGNQVNKLKEDNQNIKTLILGSNFQ